jgi:aminopeptidase N
MLGWLEADELLAVARQGIGHFSQLFDHPFPFEKLDLAFVPGYAGVGMENAGCVTLSEDFLFRGRVTQSWRDRRTDVILHEIAHMWFGSVVRIAWWNDLWLKEAMATFLSARCRAVQRPDGWTAFAIASAEARSQDEVSTAHPVAADIPSLAAIEVNYDAITYGKGAAVLRQLAAFVGDGAFTRGLRLLVRRHTGRAVRLDDLIAVLGEVADHDLTGWARSWLCSSGVDVLRVDPTVHLDGTRSFDVVRDTPAAEDHGRPHRIAVGLYARKPVDDSRRPAHIVRLARYEVDLVGARVEVPASVGSPGPDLVLPNDGELTYARSKLDRASVETLRHGIAQVVDPLARVQCWAAAWEMVRDAELAARDFLTMVESGVAAEEQDGVMQTLLWRAAVTLDNYADPQFRPIGRARLARLAADGVRTAPAGSDRQVSWAWCLALQAYEPGQLALLDGLLSGAEEIAGLVVDTELRWAILRRLVVCGRVSVDDVDNELARDPTTTGQCRAASVRAAAPTLAAKQEAWRLAIESTSIQPDLLGSVLFGFAQPDQDDLLAHFVEPYFQCLDRIWRGPVPEVAQMLVSALYPTTQVSEATVARTDRYLAEARPSPELRRLLRERMGELHRALQARACDRQASRGAVVH